MMCETTQTEIAACLSQCRFPNEQAIRDRLDKTVKDELKKSNEVELQ